MSVPPGPVSGGPRAFDPGYPPVPPDQRWLDNNRARLTRSSRWRRSGPPPLPQSDDLEQHVFGCEFELNDGSGITEYPDDEFVAGLVSMERPDHKVFKWGILAHGTRCAIFILSHRTAYTTDSPAGTGSFEFVIVENYLEEVTDRAYAGYRVWHRFSGTRTGTVKGFEAGHSGPPDPDDIFDEEATTQSSRSDEQSHRDWADEHAGTAPDIDADTLITIDSDFEIDTMVVSLPSSGVLVNNFGRAKLHQKNSWNYESFDNRHFLRLTENYLVLSEYGRDDLLIHPVEESTLWTQGFCAALTMPFLYFPRWHLEPWVAGFVDSAQPCARSSISDARVSCRQLLVTLGEALAKFVYVAADFNATAHRALC